MRLRFPLLSTPRFFLIGLLLVSPFCLSPATQAADPFQGIPVRKLSSQVKARLLADIKILARQLEQATPEQHAGLESRNNWISIESALLPAAHAATPYSCLYGGWPSQWTVKDGKKLCMWPHAGNPGYTGINQGSCGGNELLCNPALFGPGICAPFGTLQERRTPFTFCEKKFEELGRNQEEVFSSVDPAQFDELVQSVSASCGGKSQYARYNSAVCDSLRERMGDYIIDSQVRAADRANAALRSGEPEQMEAAERALSDEIDVLSVELNSRCEEPIAHHLQIRCRGFAERLVSATNLLEKLVSRSNQLATTSSGCESGPPPESISTTLSQSTDAATQAGGCTETDISFSVDNCTRDLSCVIGSGVVSMIPGSTLIGDAYYAVNGTAPGKDKCIASENSCAVQLIKGVIDSVWSLATGLWDIGALAVSGASSALSAGWDWLTGVEDKTSNAALAASSVDDSALSAFMADPAGWLTNFISGLWTEFTEYAKTSLACEEWSGLPKVSTCIKPWKGWECMSCGTYITTTCAAVGVVAAELVPAFLTGGAAAGGKWFAKGGTAAAKGIMAAARRSPRLIRALDAGTELAEAAIKTRAGSRVASAARATVSLGGHTARASREIFAATATRTRAVLTTIQESQIYKGARNRADAILSSPVLAPARQISAGVAAANEVAFAAGYGAVDSALGRAVNGTPSRVGATAGSAAAKTSAETSEAARSSRTPPATNTGSDTASAAAPRPSTVREAIAGQEYYRDRIFMDWSEPAVSEGFKLHVSATAENTAEVAAAILPVLRERGIAHKVVGTAQDYAEKMVGTQLGKFITIYPSSAEEAAEIARICDEIMTKRKLTGYRVPDERILGQSGTVSVRYGGFTKSTVTGPDGYEVRDVRGGSWKPDWVADPFPP